MRVRRSLIGYTSSNKKMLPDLHWQGENIAHVGILVK
jgi:hypothetical protein